MIQEKLKLVHQVDSLANFDEVKSEIKKQLEISYGLQSERLTIKQQAIKSLSNSKVKNTQQKPVKRVLQL